MIWNKLIQNIRRRILHENPTNNRLDSIGLEDEFEEIERLDDRTNTRPKEES